MPKRRWVRDLSWVILIVGAVAVVGPIMAQRHAREQLAACQANLENLATALEMFSTDHGGRFPGGGFGSTPRGGLGKLVPDYLKSIPTCPAAGRDTYSDSYVAGWSPDEYAVACQGRWHGDVGVGEDLPRCTSIHHLETDGSQGSDFACASPGPPTRLPRDLRVRGVACGMSKDEVGAILGQGFEEGGQTRAYRRGDRDDYPCVVSFDGTGHVRSVQATTVSWGGQSSDVMSKDLGRLVDSLGAPSAAFRASDKSYNISSRVRERWRFTDVDQGLSLIVYRQGPDYDDYRWVQLRREP